MTFVMQVFVRPGHRRRKYSLDRNGSHSPLELHMALPAVQLDCLGDPGLELLIHLLDQLTLTTKHTLPEPSHPDSQTLTF